MTTTTAREADAAILALLGATNLNLHDGYVTDSDESAKTIGAPLPYVVFYGSPGYPINPRLGGSTGRAQEFQVTSVGSTREQAVWAGDKAEAALDRTRVTIGARSRKITRTLDNAFTGRDTTWTRPDGGPLFTDVRRYVVAR